MISIDVTDPEQKIRLLRYFVMITDMSVRKGGLFSIQVGIDPLDNGVKFSVNYGPWSMPMTGKVEE